MKTVTVLYLILLALCPAFLTAAPHLLLNDPPVLYTVEITPQSVPADSQTPFTITVTADDPQGISDIFRISVNLGAIGGASDTALNDNGSGVYTLENILVPASIAPGIKYLYVQALDYGGLTDTASVPLTVTAPAVAPVIHWISVMPDAVIEQRPVSFTVKARVTDDNGQSDISAVTVNLTDAGLSIETLLDNGTYGDSLPGDSIYSRLFDNTFAIPGMFTFTVTATDLENQQDSNDVFFRVWPNYEPLIHYALFNPPSVPADGMTPFILTARVVDDNGHSDIASVTANLSSIGGSSMANLHDDGTDGDTTALDGVYTLAGQTVAPGSEPPSAEIYITATDLGGLQHANYIATLYITDPNPVDDGTRAPKYFTLHQNYPNPFNPSTQISWELPQRAMTTLSIYNILGQKIRTLTSGVFSAGRHTLLWDGKDQSGTAVSAGVYMYRLEAVPLNKTSQHAVFVANRKMILIK